MNGLVLDLSSFAGLVCHAGDISNTKGVPCNLDCALVEESVPMGSPYTGSVASTDAQISLVHSGHYGLLQIAIGGGHDPTSFSRVKPMSSRTK